MITIRAQRFWLRIVAAGVLSLAIALLWRAVQLDTAQRGSLEAAGRSDRRLSEPMATTQVPRRGKLDFSEAATLSLQLPLFDPPPPPPKVEVKPPPPPIRAQLLGTVINPSRSQAIIRDEQGSVTFRTVGESVSAAHPDAIIEEILATSIRLRRNETSETMVIQ